MRSSARPITPATTDSGRLLTALVGVLLALGLAVAQVLIGGTRLLFSLPAYGLIGLSALLAVAIVRRVRTGPSQLCLGATVLFLGYILGRAFLSPVEYLARADIYSVLAGLVIYFVVSCVFTDAKARTNIFLFLLGLAMVHVFIGVKQFRQGDNYMLISWLQRFDYGKRASGFYVCPNHLAGLLEVLAIFGVSIVVWSRYPRWVKLLVGYATAVCYAGLVLTASRGGYLSAMTSLVVFAGISLWIWQRSGSGTFWRMGAVAVIGLIILGGSATFLIGKSDFLTSRASNIVDPHNIRIDLWRAALQQWHLSPLFGTGSGTYLYYGREFRSEAMQIDPVRAHNDYLDLLAEYGVVAVLLLIPFVFVHFRHAIKDLRRLTQRHVSSSTRLVSNGLALEIGALAAVSAYLVHSIFDFNLHIPANVLLLAFVFGILANPSNDRSEHLAGRSWSMAAWRVLPALIGILIIVQCVRLLPGEYFAEKARVALRREQAGTTIRYCEQALRTEQRNPNVYDYLGQAQLMRGEARTIPKDQAWFYHEALDAFRQGRKLAPRDEDFPLQLGATLDKLGRFVEAEWMYDQALRLDPNSKWAKLFYQQHLKRWAGGAAPNS